MIQYLATSGETRDVAQRPTTYSGPGPRDKIRYRTEQVGPLYGLFRETWHGAQRLARDPVGWFDSEQEAEAAGRELMFGVEKDEEAEADADTAIEEAAAMARRT